MRLLYACSDFGIRPDGVKGASIHLRAITAALASQGHEVRLISPHGGPGGDHPAEVVDLGDFGGLRRAARALATSLDAHDLDSAVVKEIRSLLYASWAADRARDALAQWRPHAIIERLSLFSHLGLELASSLSIPLIVEVNAILSDEARRYRTLNMSGLAEQIEQRVLNGADAVLVVSDALRERVVELGVDAGRVHVGVNGVDPSLFDGAPDRDACRAALGFRDEFVVGFAGSLKAWHGVDVLIDAFGRLHAEDGSARLLIVGTGPMEAGLQTRAQRSGIADATTFTGAVEHGRIPSLLRAMDVAAAPFKRVEPFYFSPIKLFEYMAAGTCVVASRLGQIERVIEHDVNGLLCDPGSAAALSESLERLLHDPALRRRLAERARDDVGKTHTWDHAAEKTLRAIRAGSAARNARTAHSHAVEVA